MEIGLLIPMAAIFICACIAIYKSWKFLQSLK